jgi:hypothetical protein
MIEMRFLSSKNDSYKTRAITTNCPKMSAKVDQQSDLGQSPGGGRPYALNSDEEAEVLLAALEAPFVSPTETRARIELHVSVNTITRTLKAFVLQRRVARKRDVLRVRHRQE